MNWKKQTASLIPEAKRLCYIDMFVNGRFENEGTLGVAYKASTAVLFVERIGDSTTALVLYPQIEKAVAMYERVY